jgi:hypothetical protein
MNKSKSVPAKLCEEDVILMRKSVSLSEISETSPDFFYEDFFEGDGPLGIEFRDMNGDAIVKSIKKGTVASEFYDLKTEMILVDIGEKDVTSLSFLKKMKMIEKEWENGIIHLKFKKKIYKEIITILNEKNLIKYYDNFIDLGAKSLDDFDYVEIDDLTKMGFTSEEIRKFREINSNI